MQGGLVGSDLSKANTLLSMKKGFSERGGGGGAGVPASTVKQVKELVETIDRVLTS